MKISFDKVGAQKKLFTKTAEPKLEPITKMLAEAGALELNLNLFRGRSQVGESPVLGPALDLWFVCSNKLLNASSRKLFLRHNILFPLTTRQYYSFVYIRISGYLRHYKNDE